MLAREHRLRSSDEIRETIRRGKRISNRIATLHYLPANENQFAVVTSKAVGGAVVRNLVRRRAKAALYELQDKSPKLKAVLRMQPVAASASWEELSKSIRDLIARAR